MCLFRDVIVSEAQAAEHNRSIEAIVSLKISLVAAHEEVSNSLRQAQLQFVLNRSSVSATIGYGSESDVQPELDLSSLMVVAEEDRETLKERSDDGWSYDGTVVRGGLKRDENEYWGRFISGDGPADLYPCFTAAILVSLKLGSLVQLLFPCLLGV